MKRKLFGFVLSTLLILGWRLAATHDTVIVSPEVSLSQAANSTADGPDALQFPFLGDPPPPPTPEMVLRLRQAMPPTAVGVTGFSVTTTNREEVRSFFNTVFQASEDAAIGWTGDVGTCVPGTTATAFRDATALRINFYRALAGLPADIVFNGTFNTKSQQAALMMSANNSLDHFPPPSWPCYTADGAEAAANSNLALGNAGPDAIDAFIQDAGSNNQAVGHRRWLLYPQTQTMGTGDVAPTNTFNEANAVWVFDGNFGGPRPATRDTFVSWPPPGFVPYQVVYPRWSFAYPDADFSSVTVSLSTNGVSIPVTLHPLAGSIGEETLVWHPSNLNPNSTFQWPRPATDAPYAVSIQNVMINGTPTTFNYTVTVFDPAVPGPDTVLPAITGPANPTVNQSNAYTFVTVPLATSYEWRQARRAPFTAVEGAEQGLANFMTNTTPGYAVIVNSPVASGSFAFHLAHPVATDQRLTYTRNLLAGLNSQLQFQSRLGFATSGQVANVQVSLDDGQAWIDVYNQPGTGGSGESSFVARNVSLTNYAGRSILVRFRYAYTGGSFFPQTTTGIGWYVDNISFTNTEELTQPLDNPVTNGNSFAFTPTLATNYALEVRAEVYDAFHLEWGPVKSVTAVLTPTTNVLPVAVCRDLTTNANALCQAVVPATAINNGSFDPDDDPITLSLSPAGPFPLGDTVVMLTVADNRGGTNACAATITVNDQTPPAVDCPGSTITTNVPHGQSNAVVNFAVTFTDNCTLAASNCAPASGSTFPLGTNAVLCTAMDGSGNTNSCAFAVVAAELPPEPHDLAVLQLKAPKKVTLKAGTTPKPGKVQVTIQNLGPQTETFPTIQSVQNVVAVNIESLGTNCAAPTAVLQPLKSIPAVIAPNKKLKLTYLVTINCANDPLVGLGHQDYRVTVSVNHAVLDGQADTMPANDNCPRGPAGADKGCGNKTPAGTLGGDVLTDVVVK